MNLTDNYGRVALDDVSVLRDSRQRRELYDASGNFIDPEGLVDSIRQRGVLHPIILRKDGNILIVGERRLVASRLAGLRDIPFRFIEDCDPEEAETIELEENVKRLNLNWRDEARAITKLHGMYVSQAEKRGEVWGYADTHESLGRLRTNDYVDKCVAVAKELTIGNARIDGAETLTAAYNMIERKNERAIADAMNDLAEVGGGIFSGIVAHSDGDASTPVIITRAGPAERELALAAPVGPQPEHSVLHTDFAEWASTYAGPKFNFIHCDFPYGKNVFNGPQSGRDRWETTYEDSPETYSALISALGSNLDRIATPSCHLMFWLAGDIAIQHATIELFRKVAPSLYFNTYPLVWLKTDNAGILPDPKRGPRRIVETALMASREDRLVVRCVSNGYGAPTAKTTHPSVKPEPVLRHFMQMFVDENTRMLDPTCGSATSLRAAESLNAEFVLGIERNEEFVKSARSAMRTFRALRGANR